MVVTYAAFAVAVWVHPPRTYAVVLVLWIACNFGVVSTMVKDALSVWAQRVLAGLALLGAGWFVWHGRRLGTDVAIVGMYASYLLVLGSVLGWSKLVDTTQGGWMARQIEKGEPLSWWRQRALARIGYAIGLEGFAWYEYGIRFNHLAAEQRLEIEQMRRANPRGKWMRKRDHALFDDERMRHEDDRVRARVQRVMSGVLVVSAFVWYWAAESDQKVRTETVVAWAWTLAALAVTLRQAIVLWTEEDPRGVTDEIAMVQEQEV